MAQSFRHRADFDFKPDTPFIVTLDSLFLVILFGGFRHHDDHDDQRYENADQRIQHIHIAENSHRN